MPGPRPGPAAGGRGLRLSTKRILWAWAFLAVPTVFYVVIRFAPTFEAFGISFTDWNLLKPASFVGFDNYVRLVKDPLFWQVFRNTFLYLILGTPISLFLSFTVAYHLDRVRFLHGFIRALYFLPYLTTAVAMAWVWRYFFQPVPIGVINNVLAEFGIPAQPFLRSTTQALPTVLTPAIWAGMGFQIIIFLAGLRAIPVSYYEAARIDGLSERSILFRITIPLMKPTLVFLVVFASIAFLRIFDYVYNMNSNDPGGPLNSTKPLVIMIYQTAFKSYDMGYASAQTVVLFLILLAISLLQLFLMRDR
jgi:multiple sugar transport system permease protein